MDAHEFSTVRDCYVCERKVELHELRACSDCGRGRYYCVRLCRSCHRKDCTVPGHSPCWNRHLPQDRAADHVPVNPLLELLVEIATYSEPAPDLHRKLHEADRLAQWFAVKSEFVEGQVPRLHQTDRFRRLCNPGILDNLWSLRQYPGFVSFIGDTGRGKSTIVRAMILLGCVGAVSEAGQMDGGELERKIGTVVSTKTSMPVARSKAIEDLAVPTSFGVHLYRDEANVTTAHGGQDDDHRARDTPILFADCEGFGAGSNTPNAQRGDSAVLTSSHLVSDLPLTAIQDGGCKDGIDFFYARVLYTISDVVVFVIKGDADFSQAMRKLVEWAASAVHRAVNHLAQKTLVIVRNMSEFHDRELYDANILKTNLFRGLNNLWEGSAILGRFRDDFNKRQHRRAHRIDSNADLLSKFFSDVRVCYIPDKARAPANETFKQYQTLRNQIVEASQESQILRSKAWMQYNVPTLSHILDRAFEHFRTSRDPFDFYLAARNDNPNPKSVSDHIANFLRHLHLASGFPPAMVSEVISISLVSWALRTFGLVRDPAEMFARELRDLCDNGLQKFSQRDQRCGFNITEGGRCVNRRLAHNEHCDERGNRAPGPYESQQLGPDTLNNINTLFIKYYEHLCTDSHTKIFSLPDSKESSRFRKIILQEYKSIWEIMRSNKTCLSCLQSVPDHVLKCGHSFCPRCIQEFGDPAPYFECGWTVDRCALCGQSWEDLGPPFRLQPKCARARALTLDGGGIRGIIELALLEKLEDTIGLGIPLREFFDLIMGTSTGGIISLGLATKDWRVAELKDRFMALAMETFEEGREGHLVATLDYFRLTSKLFLMLHIWQSVYRRGPLKRGLQGLFGPDNYLFSPEERFVRVAVTSAKDGSVDRCLIANYNRPEFGANNDFEREDENDKEMKIWEAGLATSAAPYYFRKFHKLETQKVYVDGALHANFPVPYALEEISRLWQRPGGESTPLDILVSVGTGIQKREIEIPMPLKVGGFEEICTSFHNNLDCERKWREFKNGRGNDPDLQGKVHRLNVDIEGKYVALDHWHRMEDLNNSVAEQLKDPSAASKMEGIAASLIAALFFFEPTKHARDPMPGASRPSLAGSIRCRLARDSTYLKNLVNRVGSFWYQEVRDGTPLPLNTDLWRPIPLTDLQRYEIKTHGQWLRVPCEITPVEDRDFQQVLAVTLIRPKRSIPVPISGFPVSFQSLKMKARQR